jgi:F420-0:gamma-glutamyl ligase
VGRPEHRPPDTLAVTLRIQRKAYRDELAALAELRRSHRDEPLIALLVEAAILHTEANLRVVELAEKAPDKLLLESARGQKPGDTVERRSAASG